MTKKDVVALTGIERKPINGLRTDNSGMGIHFNIRDAVQKVGELVPSKVHEQVVHGFRFNEPMNWLGKYIYATTVQTADKAGQKGGQHAFNGNFKNLIEAFCKDYVMSVDLNNKYRVLKVSYAVFRGFNTNGHKGNPYIKLILFRYCKKRLEGTEDQMTEFGAMSHSIVEELNQQYHESKVAPGSWLLPIIHVINYHIRYYTKLPPVALHRVKSEDTKTYLPIRESNTQRVQSPKTGVMVSREGRKDVRQLLKDYIKEAAPTIALAAKQLFPESELDDDDDEVVSGDGPRRFLDSL